MQLSANIWNLVKPHKKEYLLMFNGLNFQEFSIKQYFIINK